MQTNNPMSDRDVVLCECFARDGLQHEVDFIATEQKIAVIDAFASLGFPRIEATSYSNPRVVPQFADASDLLAALPRADAVWYKATCANVRAVERALADWEQGFGANEISFLMSASESHSLKNLKSSKTDQWENISRMAALARGKFRIIGTVSVAFGCPFEGRIDVSALLRDVEQFLQVGVPYVALGDTTGMGTPPVIQSVCQKLMAEFSGSDLTLIAHFHDSRGTGLVNCLAALEAGVTHFDVAMGGVGGHPAGLKYGGGYTGNTCTEDLVNLFESMGVRTGIDLDGLLAVSALCERTLGRSLDSKVTKSGLNPLINQASAVQ